MKLRSHSFAAFIVIALLAACRADEAPDQASLVTAEATDTATATLEGSPGGTAVVPDANAGATVLVILEDGSIGVPDEGIPPGTAVLTVANRGEEVHNLFIEGDQIDRAAGDAIAAGDSTDFEVIFRPGTYTFYCPVLDHRQKGEEIQVVVNR
jgi:uncharacterized cupredoxin-like copper-binding protein